MRAVAAGDHGHSEDDLRYNRRRYFTAFGQNIFTEWHSRYRRGKRGVLIYWTVERDGAMAVHSQLLSCSASEVHAMVEGAMRPGTDMTIESNYVDSHGASLTGRGAYSIAAYSSSSIALPAPQAGTGLRAAGGGRPAGGIYCSASIERRWAVIASLIAAVLVPSVFATSSQVFSRVES
ncbi:Tn3 family transposase [Saccharopolyspora shandongensis]|uniref:Tn3 family transposase n=1 Tax=Saccharopolyspora shandongensis TaxID=418495 RepID=UPI00343087D8